MHLQNFLFQVLHLSRNPDPCLSHVNGATLKQVEKFKFAFTSDRRQDEELDTRIGKASARCVARNSQRGGCFRSLGAEPPALENFAFFAKITYFRIVLIKNDVFKTWHRNWRRNMILLVA